MTRRADPREVLGRMRLQVLVPGTGPVERGPVALAGAALRGGADAIQLRSKSLDDDRLRSVSRDLREICLEFEALLIINDRFDIAAEVEADGVHLGQSDSPPAEARRVLGAGAIIGVSSHSEEEARIAAAAGADYIAVGCVYPSPTKPELEAVGPAMIARVAALGLGRPLVAIGGITPATVPECIAAGARAVAVASAVTGAADPEAAARAIVEAIRQP